MRLAYHSIYILVVMRENFIGLVKAAKWGDEVYKLLHGAEQQATKRLWGNFGRSLRNLGRDTAALGGHYGKRALNYTRDTVIPAAERLGRQGLNYTRNTVLPAAGRLGRQAFDYTVNSVIPTAGRLGRQAAEGISRFTRNKFIPYWNRLDPNTRRNILIGGGLVGGGAFVRLKDRLRDETSGGSGSSEEDPIESKYSPLMRPIVRYVKDYEKNVPKVPINVNPSGGDTGVEYRNRNENPFGEPSFKIRDPHEFPQN